MLQALRHNRHELNFSKKYAALMIHNIDFYMVFYIETNAATSLTYRVSSLPRVLNCSSTHTFC